MKPSRKTFFIAGIVAFALALILFMPARVAYQWFAPDTVQLAGIGGTVWSGQAREFSASGVYLRDLKWRLKPLGMLTGKIALDLEANPSSGFIEAGVALGLGGKVLIDDLTGSLPLQLFASPLRMPGLAGNASLQFARIEIRDGLPVVADGNLAVAGLVAPIVDPGPLGAYRADFFTAEDGVVASVEDTNAVFDLAGSLTVSSDRSYQFLGQVAPTDRTPEKLRRQLRFLGSPNERGQHEIRLEGSL